MKKISYIYLTILALIWCVSFNVANEPTNLIDSPIDTAITLLPKVNDPAKKQELFSTILYSYIDSGQLDKLSILIQSNILGSQAIFKSLSADLVLYFYSRHSATKTISFLQTLSPNLISFLTETCFYEALSNGNINDAILFSESLKENIIYSRLILSILDFYLQQDDISSAISWFVQIELPSENDQALKQFCLYYANKNKQAELTTHLNLIQTEKIKLSVYSQLAQIYAKKNLLNLSDNYLNFVIGTAYEQDCLVNLIKIYSLNNNLDKALFFAGKITSQPLKFKALVGLATGFAKNSNFVGVNESFKQLASTTQQEQFIINIAPILAEEKFIDEAFALTTKVGLETNETLMKRLAFNFGKYCDYNFSKLTLEKIPNPEIKNAALTSFSLGLADINNYSNVLNSLDLIDSKAQKDKAILAIINTSKFLDKTEDLLDKLSPKAKLNYVYEFTNQGINSTNADLGFDILLSFSKRSLSKEDAALYYVKLAELYAYENLPKKTTKYIKKAYSQLKKLKFKVSSNTVNTFVKKASEYNEFKLAFTALSKYPNKYEQLFFLISLELSADPKKRQSEIKNLEIFAKKY